MSKKRRKGIKKGQVAELIQRQWKKDNQEWEQIKREWETYKAANEAAREAHAFFNFVAALSAKRFKKQRSAILGKITAEDLMLVVNRGPPTIIGSDAAELICQAVSQRDEAFFKALGRALTGKKFNSVGLDKYNTAIARLIYDGNTESGRRKLKKEFPEMEPCFREYRKRLLDMLPPEYQYLDHRGKQRKEGKKSQNRNKRNRT
jgi:hypothetical protein